MSDRHVVPAEDGWQVEKDHAQRPSAKTATQAEAVSRALEIVANDGGGEVVIHGTDGQVRETRTVEAGAQTTATEAAMATAATEARAAADRGLEVVEDTAGHAGEAVRGGADRAATIGGQLENELDTTADRTARKVRTLTERAAQPLDKTTGQLLDTLARLTRALNPVRVTGRVVEIGATATLRTAGALTSRGGRSTQSTARALTGHR
jgi:hypothetical protein